MSQKTTYVIIAITTKIVGGSHHDRIAIGFFTTTYMQSVSITTKVGSLNLVQARCT